MPAAGRGVALVAMLLFALKRVLDYPLTLDLTVVLTTCVLAVNTLSDIALAAIDPRVREATSGRSA